MQHASPRSGRAALYHICASFLAILVLSAHAATACVIPDLRTNERPGDPNTATPITVSIQVLDLLGVDDVNQQLEIDFFARLTWEDPRLASLDGCRVNITEVWFPEIRILNSSSLREAFKNARNEVAIGESGQVTYVQRFTGFVSSYHNLLDFPFDHHELEINFGAVRSPEKDLVFIPDSTETWLNDRLNIEGWEINRVWLETGSIFLRQSGHTLSEVTLKIEAKRMVDYFVYRVLLLLAFVVGMSWVVFWVPPSRFEFQIGIGATSMLTAIAFNIAIAGQLPRLGYLTTLDKMVIWATLLIFLSIIEALVAGRMVLSGREPLALKIDLASRFIFPALLIIGWFLMVYRTGVLSG